MVVYSDKPGSPEDLRVTGTTENSVSLSWEPPRENGGSEVTGYVLEKRDALRMGWQSAGTTSNTSYTFTRLSEGVQYVFRVAAENRIGAGIPEELSQAIAAKSPHGQYN